jgi:hypothetical protein
MKMNSTAIKQILKPIFYILLYLGILILLMNFLTIAVNAETGDKNPDKIEINIH